MEASVPQLIAGDASRRYHVLLVEDNLGDADLTMERLASMPSAVLSVRHVTTLAAALAALAHEPIGAIVLDLHLPDSHGLETLAAVRAAARGAPIVVVSGLVDEEQRRQLEESGASEVLSKDEANSRLFLRSLLFMIERHRAQQDQRQLEALLEVTPDAVLVVEKANGAVRYLNQAAVRLFGRDRDDFVGERLGFSIRDGATIELSVPRPDGTRLCEIRVISSEWGGQEAFLGFLRDITVARRNEVRFQRLAESGIIGIVTADLGGQVLDANDAFLEMTGHSRQEVAEGQVRWNELIAPGYTPVVLAAIEQLEQVGVATPFELEMLRKDGSQVPLLVGAAMLEQPRLIAFTADLSDRKRAESARSAAESALRRSEEQLRQAQKMEAVGRLAGGVAHDFNNLLSVILTYSSFILSDLSPEDPVHGHALEIEKAGTRAASMTRQLLMFSRQQVVAPRLLDLNEVLSSMHKMLARILGEDVDLIPLLAKDLGLVRADPGSVDQLILNLVVNARDAMPTGGKLTIETADVVLDEAFAAAHAGTVPGAYVMLSVSDTGVGMDQATQARIFEPFFTTKDKSKGTGLGLSTVFGIVQQSHGSIWVDSEVGVGSTFRIYLPRDFAHREEVRPAPELASKRGSETILLVEDDEQVRVVASGILRRHGYRVIDVANAGEALLICEREGRPIDLLLTDVVMPHVSGPELAKRLQVLRPELRVLFVSGYTDDSIVRHGVRAAELAFLQKPLTPENLSRKVREILDGPARKDSRR